MRVLASTTAGGGHFGPLLPVLRGCVERGHDVLVACPSSFTAEVSRAGFACAPFDDARADEMAAVFARLPGLSYEEANRVVVRDAFATLDAGAALPRLAETFVRFRPDVVVRDPAEYASWVLAERHGVPGVRVAIGLLASDEAYAGFAAAALAEIGDRHGVRVDPGGRQLLTGPVLAAAPATFDPPAGPERGTVQRYAPAPPPPSRRPPVRFPPGDEPLVYLSWGTVAASLGLWPAAYRLLVEALADAPVRVLVTTGWGVDLSALGALPPRVAVTHFVAQQEVLPHAAVLVTHGGYGTVLGGLEAGVRMVVTPLFADQQANAARVEVVGAGVDVSLSSRPMHVEPALGDAVRAAVLALLGDAEVAAVARRLADEMAAHPSVDAAVDVVAGAG